MLAVLLVAYSETYSLAGEQKSNARGRFRSSPILQNIGHKSFCFSTFVRHREGSMREQRAVQIQGMR